MNWFLFWLLLHVAAAIIGIGPSFAFSLMGAYLESHPGSLTVGAGLIELISRRLVVPVAGTMLISGLALVYVSRINLLQTPWLLISLILYLGVMGAATGHQLPRTARIVALSREPGGGPPSAELLGLVNRVKYVGMAMTLAVVVIIVLMVLKPGGITYTS